MPGVLYLTAAAADQGGFQCVPGSPAALPSGFAPSRPIAIRAAPISPVSRYGRSPGRAGDLLIWNSLLPHGNGENTSERPRLAQHISPFPAARGNEQDRRERIAAWREQRSVISAHVASADRRSMIELSPRLIGSSTDPAGSQGALGHSFGAAGSAMKNAKNPSSQRPSATDSAPCRLTNPTFPWLDGSHRLRLIFTKFTVTSSYGST